jgi:autotransporter-associated beta strand protein
VAWTDTTGTSDTANFAGTAGTVTLGTNLGALGLSFTTPGYTIALGANTLTLGTLGIAASSLSSGTTTISGAGTLALGDNQTWNIGSGATLAVSSAITGGFGLTKSNGGTLVLTGANTYTGTTAITGGTLNVGNGTATGSISSSSALALGGGTLSYTTTGTNTQTFNGTTVNAGFSTVTNATATNTVALGALTRNTGGILNISSLTGVTTTSSTPDATGILGTWATTGTGTILRYATTSSGTITGYSGGTAAATAASVTDTTGAVNYDVAAVGALGAGASFNTLRFTGGTGGNITGDFTANGLMNAGTAQNTYTGNVTIGANKDLVIVSNGQNITLSGVVADNGGGASALTYGGPSAGTLTLSGANTYSGPTTIGSGILKYAKTISMSAASAVSVGTGATLAANVGGAGEFTTGTGNGTINGLFSGLGGQSGSAITYAAGSAVGVDTTNAGSTVTESSNLTTSGVGLTKLGTGTLALSGSNSFTGATTITAGTLEFQGASSMSTGSVLTMASGSTMSLKADADTTFAPVSLGAFNPNSTYNFQVNSLNSPSGDGHTLTLNGQTAASTGNNTQTITINVASTTGDTLKFGTSTYQLSGGSGGAFGGNSNTFNLNGANVILNGLSNSTTNGDVFITVASTSGNSLTLNGQVASNGSRTIGAIVNSGVLTLNNTVNGLNGANTGFWVTLNGGTLNLNNAAAINNNNHAAHGNNGFVIAGGTLNNTSGSAVTLNTNASMGIGINGDFAFSTAGGTSANNLSLGTNAVTLGTPAGTSRTITTNGSATLTIGGIISNGTTANSLIKAGTGTLKLSGVNTYTGSTSVTDGTLDVASGGSIGTSSGLTVNGANAVLAGAGTVSGINLTSGAISPGEGGIGTLSGSSLAWNGGSLNFDLSSSGATSDTLALTGDFGPGTGSTFVFNLSGGQAGQTYTLVTFGSTSFASASQFTSTGVNGSFTLNGSNLTFTAVPEPSTMALMAIGLGAFAWRLRRVRQPRWS